jgi:hypothetical protein
MLEVYPVGPDPYCPETTEFITYFRTSDYRLFKTRVRINNEIFFSDDDENVLSFLRLLRGDILTSRDRFLEENNATLFIPEE